MTMAKISVGFQTHAVIVKLPMVFSCVWKLKE